MNAASWILLIAAAWGADEHASNNPVFAQLRDPGLEMAGSLLVPLPAPTLPDGATPAEQRQVLEELAGTRYPLSQLTRNSVVAPHILRVSEEPLAEGGKFWRIDFWGVAYGSLDTVADEEFLKNLWGKSKGDVEQAAESQSPPADVLRARGIEPPATDRESYSRAEIDVLHRLRLAVVTHGAWSRTDDSVLAAAMVDPRFTEVEQWSNRWWPTEQTDQGDTATGEARPYHGAGMYVKITRLAEPEGALLIEGHTIYREPHDWFDGANLLVSKLPLVVQDQVRTMRRELLLAK